MAAASTSSAAAGHATPVRGAAGSPRPRTPPELLPMYASAADRGDAGASRSRPVQAATASAARYWPWMGGDWRATGCRTDGRESDWMWEGPSGCGCHCWRLGRRGGGGGRIVSICQRNRVEPRERADAEQSRCSCVGVCRVFFPSVEKLAPDGWV
jgi:hypothetical protein